MCRNNDKMCRNDDKMCRNYDKMCKNYDKMCRNYDKLCYSKINSATTPIMGRNINFSREFRVLALTAMQ